MKKCEGKVHFLRQNRHSFGDKLEGSLKHFSLILLHEENYVPTHSIAKKTKQHSAATIKDG